MRPAVKRLAILAFLLLFAAGAHAALDESSLAYSAPTPDAKPLEEKAAAFRLKLLGAGRIASDKEAALAKRGAEILRRELAKYQAAGDFDRTTAFSEALAKPDGEIESSVAEIKTFYDWRRAQLAAIRKERAEAQAKAAAEFSAELAEWKKELVREGKLAVAKEVNAYEGAVNAALAALRAEAGIPDPPASAKDEASKPAAKAEEGGFRMPLGRDITVWASNGQGVVLGDLNAGDIAVFRFTEGSWSDSPRP